LHVAQRHAGVERGGDNERVSERVRADGFGDPGPARDLADDPPCAMAVQPPPVGGEEDGAVAAFAGGQVDRRGGAGCGRGGDDLAALAGDRQGPVPALQAQVLDISAGGLRYPQPVQREQRDQRMLGRRAQPAATSRAPGSLRNGGMRLIVQAGPSDMRGRGMIQEFFFDRVAVEP
jgi:hypothetical protein